MNKITAYTAYFLILLQPIILSYLSYDNINSKKQNILILLCLSFLIFGLFSFYQNHKSKKFRISYIENVCENTFCNLEWEFINLNFYHNLIFVLFYFGIAAFVGYYRQIYYNSILPILTFLLGLTILYMMIKTKKIKLFNVSFIGSLWCFLCVVAGPLVIMNKNLAF